MKTTRKIISLLLSVLMIITSVPLMAVNSFAADVVQSGTTGECTWTLDGTVLTISGNGKMKDYNWEEAPWGTSITEVIIENGVTDIGECAFQSCTSLESVNIPESVTEIGSVAFLGCTSLTSVNIPDSVTSIGNSTFSGCTSLTSVNISDSVTSICYQAFCNCTSLTSITIPNSVTRIDSSAFSYCTSLTSITIPDSVTGIGPCAFENTAYYNNESNWENSLLYIGNHLIKAKKDVSGNVEIKQGAKTIADSAFENCTSLTSITIPDSVTSIGYIAFSGCISLTSINIPDGVTSIYIHTFSGCTSLTSVTIPDSVTYIDGSAFEGCTSLESVTIPDSVTYIGVSAFENTAYYNNESNWENSLLYIGNHLIKAKNNVSGSVEIKQGTKTISEFAFENCTSLTSVTIPDSVTSIGYGAFMGCTSLTSVKIGNGVTSIAIYAFSGCTSLTIVTIPDSVTEIGWNAFEGCTSLKRIDVAEGNQNYASVDGILYNKDKTILKYCPACCEAEAITIPDSVTKISDNAFSDCKSLTSVTIGNSVKSIGYQAFWNCTSLTSIIIPDSVTSIGSEAFCDCTSLTSITIPDSVTSIDSGTFWNCTSLTSVTIPDSVTDIGEYAFGYYDDSIENKIKTVDDFKIYGTVGSEAERYADDNRLEFISIDGTPVKSFPDVTREDWYYSAVKYNSRNSYVTGYQNGTFGPSNNIQRQDFVLILARIAGADLSAYEGQNGGFSDVQTGSYYASAVAWAKDKGVANGFSADNFGVGTFISREQICIMLCRYLNGSASGDVDAILNAYSDGGNTSPWAKAGVAWAVENDIIGNSDYLNPNGNAGRAEVAQIIYNMSNKGMI